MHLRTYVDINYFDCLHVRNSFLNLCRVFLKHLYIGYFKMNHFSESLYMWLDLINLCFKISPLMKIPATEIKSSFWIT
jgi:hypothetical protein